MLFIIIIWQSYDMVSNGFRKSDPHIAPLINAPKWIARAGADFSKGRVRMPDHADLAEDDGDRGRKEITPIRYLTGTPAEGLRRSPIRRRFYRLLCRVPGRLLFQSLPRPWLSFIRYGGYPNY